MSESNTVNNQKTDRWWDFAEFSRIFAALGMALRPASLAIALMALILTFGSGLILDWIWLSSGQGVEISSKASGAEQRGVFEVWWATERTALLGCADSVRHWNILGSSSPDLAEIDSFLAKRLQIARKAGLMTDQPPQMLLQQGGGLVGGVYAAIGGIWWMLKEHTVYAVVFGLLSLAIWALAGGAICRMHAARLSVDARIELGRALQYSKEHWLGGFAPAPLTPLLFVLIIGVLLFLGGLFLSIPWIGDIIGGLLFILAIMGGFVIALCVLLSAIGISLFWPAVAADGYDGTECVVHSLGYVGARPVRTVWLLFVSFVYSIVCWLLISLFVWFALHCTHWFVGLGTDVFTDRAVPVGHGTPGEVSKMDVLWTIGDGVDFFAVSALPLETHDNVSHWLVGAWVFLLVGLVWALLINLWFACTTTVYFLLRKEVDGVAFERFHLPGEEDGGDTREVGNQAEETSENDAGRPQEKDEPERGETSGPPEE